MDVLRLIVAEHNRWMDADLAQLARTHAELTAQVLSRMPPVIPRPQRGGSRPRAMRTDADPHPTGWGHGTKAR